MSSATDADRGDVIEQAKRYKTWASRTALSDNTANRYAQRVAEFCQWVHDQGEDQAGALVDEDGRDYATRKWRQHLMQERKVSASTVAQHQSALRSFYHWLGMDPPSFPTNQPAAKEKRGLEQDTFNRLLTAAKARGPRDNALVMTMALCGLRIGETEHLDVDDVYVSERTGTVHVRFGKGGKSRQVPVGAAARGGVRAWLTARADMPGVSADRGPLWLTLRGAPTRLTRRGIQNTVKELGRQIGEPALHAHQLRHTYGRRMVEAGVPIADLQTLMGHAAPSTTMGYTNASKEKMQDHADALDAGLDV